MTVPKSVSSVSSVWSEVMAFVTMLLSYFHMGPPKPVADAFAAHNIAPQAVPSWLWTIILGLLARTPALIAIVEADLAAGKTFLDILKDILSAMVGPNPPIPPPAKP